MKKFFFGILILLLLFLGLTYWSVSNTHKEFETCKLINFPDKSKVDYKNRDSVMVIPSTLYQGNAVKKFMQGKNYRKEWATPVKVPVVFLDTLYGGMKILKEGGGTQTQSLRLRSAEGTVYSLRSVDKDPQALIPPIAHKLGLENIIVDGISGQHPYAALLAGKLANAAGVFNTHPWMIFVPHQKILGKYNKKYGDRLYLLEYETEGDKNWSSLSHIQKIADTEDLQHLKEKMKDSLSIDKNLLVRSRLFDMVIGDWDRHAKQWGWFLQQHKNGITAIPLAGDRDNAFFDMDGIIPAILTNQYVQPLVRPFEEDIDYMLGLVYPFDVYFLKNTPKEVFIKQAKILQTRLNDSVIDAAFKVWPPQIYKLDGKEISRKIKSRRNHLLKYAHQFRNVIQDRDVLHEPLKGTDGKLSKKVEECFDC